MRTVTLKNYSSPTLGFNWECEEQCAQVMTLSNFSNTAYDLWSIHAKRLSSLYDMTKKHIFALFTVVLVTVLLM